MVELRGDFPGLSKLTARLGKFQFSKIPPAIGGEVKSQYEADWPAQRDPWGESWNNASGKTPVNFLTGDLANPGLTVGGNSIKLNLAKHWVFRQVGANGAIPAAVVPFGDIERTAWAVALVAEVKKIIASQLGEKP